MGQRKTAAISGGAASIDLENGPWIYAFELPVAAVKITGSNLGSNATLVATMMSWR